MKSFTFRFGLFLGALSFFIPTSRAAQVAVVLRTGPSLWRLVEGEKILVNAKDRLRIAESAGAQIDPADYKRMKPEQVLRAGSLRRNSAGCLVRKEGANWMPVLPDGVNLKSRTSCAALWSSASITVQQEKGAKGGDSLKPENVFAILPGADPSESVADLLGDPANFRGLGEVDEAAAFDERMSLFVGVAGVVTGPAAAKLQQIPLQEMETANQRLSGGVARYSDLQHGLQYVAVSAKAYPNDPQQKKAREALLTKRDWLATRIAVLKAFAAGELWDPFLDKYGEFDRYDNSFDEVRKLHDKALEESANRHWNEGQKLYAEKNYPLAMHELKLAALRSPGNQEISKLIEKVSFDEARSAVHREKEDTTSPRYAQMIKHLTQAERSLTDKKFPEAERQLREAEEIDKDSVKVLFTRAELLRAEGKLQQALDVVGQYNRRVSAEGDIEKGSKLEGDITYDLESQRDKLKQDTEKAEADGDYVLARQSAQAGAELDPSNLFFLLHAGRNNAILRDRDTAARQLKEYLRLSQASGGEEKTRTEVYSNLAALSATITEPEGNPNWYSGYKSPAGLFYCPISLMPNPHPAEVQSSRKQTTVFQWNGDTLTSVETRSAQPGESEVRVYFDVFKNHNAVRRVAPEPFPPNEEAGTPRLTEKGPVGSGKGAYVALRNDPVIDPVMVERLTGKRVATIVAGNAYFHPFVWDGIYSFLAEYDDQGRVKSATRISGPAQGPRILDFKWDGLRLMSISERGGESYTRTMTYDGSKLVGETISFRGKGSKIEYKYRGDRLEEADCAADFSLDGRSRRVTFR